MTSKPDELYVWIWLPDQQDPVVAGRLFRDGSVVGFEYGQSYLNRPDATSIYEPELPLIERRQYPAATDFHGCIADAGPDSWGQRVIDRELGEGFVDDELTYLAHSGSDRVGALDFQASSTEYVPRTAAHATLEDLAEAAARVDENRPLNEELKAVLLYGSAVGGARPKALIDDSGRKLIAKFSSSGDTYPIVKGEFIAMQLASRCGIETAHTELTRALGKDVLMVERFDRLRGGCRRLMVSALTILGLPALAQPDGSYELLAVRMRERFEHHRESQRELFARIAFNILCSNTDDHLRNHSAFWDGDALALTPAYDICPYPRAGEATLATAIDSSYRFANVNGLVERASLFQLAESDARDIVDRQVSVIETAWKDVCDLAELPETHRGQFWKSQFLNPAAFYD